MISYAAPVGVSQVTLAGGTFDVASGILQLTDAASAALDADLATLGFVNLGSSTLTTARVASGQIAAIGPSDPLLAVGAINISVWAVNAGAPVTASFTVERTFDNGATWLPLTLLDQPIAITGPFSTSFTEPENGVLYRLRCTAFAGGAANYRLSHS